MWVATMGQKTVGTTNLPDVENVVVTKQYIGGSLFKSQNGTIWTASQYQDLTFKLRKASFVNSGSTTFYNTAVEAGNLNTQVLSSNPIRTLPRKLVVKLTSAGANESVLPIGRKVSTGAEGDAEDVSVTGIIEGRGAPISSNTSFSIVTRGSGYELSNPNNIPLISLTGSGTGAQCSVSLTNGIVDSNGVSNLTLGTGYQIGEVLTIDNSDAKVLRGSGFKLVVTAISNTLDTLFLTDVQGDKFPNSEVLIQYTSNNTTRTTVSPATTVNGDSTVNGDLYSGKVIDVTQYNHAHHGATNQVEIKNVKPDTTLVPISETINSDATSVSIANTSPFNSFGGITTDRGEALIGEELVSYVVGTGVLTLTRGILNTTATTHDEGATIQTYESSGMPSVSYTHLTLPTILRV